MFANEVERPHPLRSAEQRMETYLSYNAEEKQLHIQAKEKLFIDPSSLLQIHGRLNTRTGAASGVAQFKRRFYPEILSSIDVGMKYHSELREFTFDLQGKKTLPITNNGLFSVDTKAGYNFNPGSQKGKQRGAVELTYKLFNFTQDQDVRLKIGFDLFDKKPYFQVRENNWTLNTDIDGRWSVKYDL